MDSVTNTDVTQAVREAAMLADVTISMWGAERSDRALTEQLKVQHGATGAVGKFVKNMLAGADTKLKEVKSAYNAVRTTHYAYTLPWVSDPHAERQRGPRLLPHLLFDKYLQALSLQKRKAEAALADFLVDYPNLVQQARANLGGMADATYPTEDEVKAQFRIHIDFEPIPAGAAFKGLPDHALERLAGALHKKQQRMIDEATKAMWDEAKDRVTHIVDRLGDPKARFKSSTVEGVRELLTLLPGWNLAGDPRVGEVVEGIKVMLDGVTAEEIRKDENLRASVADQAKQVANKLSGWGL